MSKEEKPPITREMTIDEIFTSFPQKGQRLAQEMTNAGLHCAGCQAATWETLEGGMLGHGFEEKDIEALICRLNEIIAEEVDPTTITLTKRAADRFKSILEQDGKKGWGLRFGDKPGGCGGFEYILDFSKSPTEEDTIFTSHGVQIHVKAKMLSRLLGSEIDYLEGLMDSGFKVTNPNVKGSCSCGSSQSY
jgi:iron-sulfur cluster assembly protein